MWVRVENLENNDCSIVEVPFKRIRELQAAIITCNRSRGYENFVVLARTAMGNYGLEEWSGNGRVLLRKFTRV